MSQSMTNSDGVLVSRSVVSQSYLFSTHCNRIWSGYDRLQSHWYSRLAIIYCTLEILTVIKVNVVRDALYRIVKIKHGVTGCHPQAHPTRYQTSGQEMYMKINVLTCQWRWSLCGSPTEVACGSGMPWASWWGPWTGCNEVCMTSCLTWSESRRHGLQELP